MIRVSNLRKSFRDTVAVDGVSFEVRDGEIVGFLGPNGAGKSTTMRMLTTYLDPDEGTIEIAGLDAVARPLDARRRIGYLPESAPLLEELGVLESLSFTARLHGLGRARLRDRIDAMVEACGLQEVVGREVGELSKGYRQRLGLAQALVHDPPFLVLDEPTSGLDPNQIQEIRRLVREIGRDKTILLSTHILPEVQATCDRALILHRGRIVADDSTDALAARAAREGVRVRVRLRGATAEEARRRLDALEGVRSVSEVVEEDGGLVSLVLTVACEEDCEQVFLAAREFGWMLRELAVERLSLEEVFSRLTMGETEGES